MHPASVVGTLAPSDQTLFNAARQGDAEAFDRLMAPFRGGLHAHGYRMLGSVQDTEDVLQDTLLGAWRGLPVFLGVKEQRSLTLTQSNAYDSGYLDLRYRSA